MSNSVSIITPTFRGREKLINVYNSIESQTIQPKQWIIIIDGFDKRTEEICKQFESHEYDVIILSKTHNHKKSAINFGLDFVTSDFVLIADDDDVFPQNALNTLLRAYNELSHELKLDCCGVTGLCYNKEGFVYGEKFPVDKVLMSSIEMTLKHKVKGEKWGMTKTEVLKDHPFFEQPRGYVGESSVWWKIGLSYKTLFVNEFVRQYNFNPQGIMNGKISEQRLQGNVDAYCWSYLETTSNYLQYYFKWDLVYLLKCASMYVKWYLWCGYFGQLKGYHNPKQRLNTIFVFLLGLPLGSLLFIRDYIKIKWH